MEEENNISLKVYELPSCSICLAYLNENIVGLKCGHVYHQDCLKQNEAYRTKCPSCNHHYQNDELTNIYYQPVERKRFTITSEGDLQNGAIRFAVWQEDNRVEIRTKQLNEKVVKLQEDYQELQVEYDRLKGGKKERLILPIHKKQGFIYENWQDEENKQSKTAKPLRRFTKMRQQIAELKDQIEQKDKEISDFNLYRFELENIVKNKQEAIKFMEEIHKRDLYKKDYDIQKLKKLLYREKEKEEPRKAQQYYQLQKKENLTVQNKKIEKENQGNEKIKVFQHNIASEQKFGEQQMTKLGLRERTNNLRRNLISGLIKKSSMQLHVEKNRLQDSKYVLGQNYKGKRNFVDYFKSFEEELCNISRERARKQIKIEQSLAQNLEKQ